MIVPAKKEPLFIGMIRSGSFYKRFRGSHKGNHIQCPATSAPTQQEKGPARNPLLYYMPNFVKISNELKVF